MNNLLPTNPKPIKNKADVQYGANNTIILLPNTVFENYISIKLDEK